MLDHLLICGLGSIGQRHLRHFRALGVRRIDALRSGRGTLPIADGQKPDHEYRDLESALAEHPQAVVVANPTSFHLSTAQAALDARAHVLVEKPLSHTLEGCDELLKSAARAKKVLAIGCNLRFHPLLRQMRELVVGGRLGRPLLARAHFGSFLPDWHPWENFHTGYAARQDLGGGALLTHIHEIDYLGWILGPIEESYGTASTSHPLGTTVDELAAAVLRHTSGTLSVVSLSLAEKPPSRTLHLAFEGGTATLDLLSDHLSIRTATGEESMHPADLSFDIDQTYASQAQAFLQALQSGDLGDLANGQAGLDALRATLAIGT
jgi:predicted dehydrogenase